MKLLLKVALFGFTSGAALPSILGVTAEIPAEERRSGYEFLSRDTKAMQDDETANPGMLAVQRARPYGNAQKTPPENPAQAVTEMRAPA